MELITSCHLIISVILEQYLHMQLNGILKLLLNFF
ncbi:hypothetical protein A6R68_19275 [Neotoma lepida]|uniref:Uncharacterized protein n=1 Tax=Neotoma lepida TaxID=56216 RepID=A0A1A6HIF8_NEOLE|nr:hypothetical protein A6R68_19275 [Neotoma lepida]